MTLEDVRFLEEGELIQDGDYLYDTWGYPSFVRIHPSDFGKRVQKKLSWAKVVRPQLNSIKYFGELK